MSEDIINKISKLLDSGLQVCFHNGAVYHGAVEHRSGLRKLTATNIENYYSSNMNNEDVRNNWVNPVEAVTALEGLAQAEVQANREAMIANGQLFERSIDFVRFHIERDQYEWDDKGLIFTTKFGGRVSVSQTALISDLRLKMSDYNFHQADGTKLSKDDIQHCLNVIETEMTKKKEVTLQNTLKYSGKMTQDTLFRVVGELLDIYFIKNTHENVLAFCHLLWQIKRKIYMLPIEEELIYSFYSKTQHLGKTYFIRSLANPFSWAYNGKCKVADLLDANRLKSQVRGKYLIDIQEMAIGGYTDTSSLDIANTMKTMVGDGEGTVSGRDLYTSTNGVEYQSAVFTTSTNVHVAEVVCDPTGMRRYWEFELNPPTGFDRSFYLKANAYLDNILDIYQAIDENDPHGFYSPLHPVHGKFYTDMFEIQNALGKFDALTEWMNKKNIQVDDEPSEGFSKITLKAFVKKFNRYMVRVEGVEKEFKTFFVTNILHKIHNVEPFVDDENGKEAKYLYILEGDEDE